MTGEYRNELDNKAKYDYVGRNLARVKIPLLHVEMTEWQHLCVYLPLALPFGCLSFWRCGRFPLTCLGFPRIPPAIPDWVPKSKCLQRYFCKAVLEGRATHSALKSCPLGALSKLWNQN